MIITIDLKGCERMEKTLKYSRQREAIIENLRNRYDHPTAEQLYTDLRKKYPKLSLGTVYRNLALLEKLGEVIKISASGDSDHFDSTVNNHYHFACTECGGVTDVNMPVDEKLDTMVGELTKADIKTHSLIFYGTCEKCKKKA